MADIDPIQEISGTTNPSMFGWSSRWWQAPYIRPPDGGVEVLSLSNGVARWVDRFQVPGEYRMNIATKGQFSQWCTCSVYVDQAPEEPSFLRMVPCG